MWVNAKEELLAHSKDRSVVYAIIELNTDFNGPREIRGSLSELLPSLNFEYNNVSHCPVIKSGTIWYQDGTWSERVTGVTEYWIHRCPPALPLDVGTTEEKPISKFMISIVVEAESDTHPEIVRDDFLELLGYNLESQIVSIECTKVED